MIPEYFRHLRTISKVVNEGDDSYIVSYIDSNTQTTQEKILTTEDMRRLFEGQKISFSSFLNDYFPYMQTGELQRIYADIISCQYYKYGMPKRPFSLGTYPNNDNFMQCVDGETIGGKKYYNILFYAEPLSKKDIYSYELADLNGNGGGNNQSKSQEAIIEFFDEVKELVKKDLKNGTGEKYLSKKFFSSIGISEEDFLDVLSQGGYKNSVELFEEILSEWMAEEEKDAIYRKKMRISLKDDFSKIIFNPSPKKIYDYLNANSSVPAESHPVKPGIAYALSLNTDNHDIYNSAIRKLLSNSDIANYRNFIKNQFAISVFPYDQAVSDNFDEHIFDAIKSVQEFNNKKYISKYFASDLKELCNGNIENCISDILRSYPFVEQSDRKVIEGILSPAKHYAMAIGENSLSKIIDFINYDKITLLPDDIAMLATQIRDMAGVSNKEIKNNFAEHIIKNRQLEDGNDGEGMLKFKLLENATLQISPRYDAYVSLKRDSGLVYSYDPNGDFMYPFIEAAKKIYPNYFLPIDKFVAIDKIANNGIYFTVCKNMEIGKVYRENLYTNIDRNGAIIPNKYGEKDHLISLVLTYEDGSYWHTSGNNMTKTQRALVSALMRPVTDEIPSYLSFMSKEMDDARMNFKISQKSAKSAESITADDSIKAGNKKAGAVKSKGPRL